MKSTDLRPGMAVTIDGNLYVITQYNHVTPGNLRAFVQVKIKSVKSGQTVEKRLRSGEEVEVAHLDRRELEYLYSDNNGCVFMDTENYEQFTLGTDVMGTAMKYLKANTRIVGLVNEGNVVTIELPKTVDLKVTDTVPGIKGATATNVQKDATMETGLVTRVPDFIKVGELVRINTENGTYQSRV
ncbi:MAG: elongation factor P [Phycisphaeraceae bacterium]